MNVTQASAFIVLYVLLMHGQHLEMTSAQTLTFMHYGNPNVHVFGL